MTQTGPADVAASALVFAYHDVGCRCLSTLLAHGVKIPLVVTHRDDPAEHIWFSSVAALAARHEIPVVTPSDPNQAKWINRFATAAPQFIFSFYYRQMLKPNLLALATRGALNMHGSLLPRYRGRAPVNWAVINGEHETGATLHYMTEKPDAGDIVDQCPVAILPDDTAVDVFHKVTDAAATVLDRSLPALLAGNAPRIRQNLSAGSYFGGRRPDDGLINWAHPAPRIHNLVRGVAPPYPGAFTRLSGAILRILRTHLEPRKVDGPPRLLAANDACYAVCSDGGLLHLIEIELDGRVLTADEFARRFNEYPLPLEQP